MNKHIKKIKPAAKPPEEKTVKTTSILACEPGREGG